MCDPKDNTQMVAITLLVLFTTYLLGESKRVIALKASEKPCWKTQLCRTCSSQVCPENLGAGLVLGWMVRTQLRMRGREGLFLLGWHIFTAVTRVATPIHNFQEAKSSPRACRPAVRFKLTFPGSPSECIIPESPGFGLACWNCDTQE